MLALKSYANGRVISNAATRCCFGSHQRRHVFFCKSVWGLQKSRLRRRTLPVFSTYASKFKESESMEEIDSDRPDGSWFTAGLVLTAGGLIPSLVTCFLAKEVLAMDSRQRLALFLATDVVFALTSYAFLLVGEAFGRERLEGRAIEPYPGPWKEPSGVRILPKYFRKYLLALPASVGLFLPVATVVASCLWTDSGELAATCLGPYVATLLSQIWMENIFVKRGSFMWPMVPVTHMIYRLWQLGRGSVLVAVLDGPPYLQYLHATLAIVWVLNFGAVMAWMPWLYRWHHQPKSSVD